MTALCRPESSKALPSGVKRVTVDFKDKNSLTAALKGQQFLIITLPVTATPDLHPRIVEAAGDAGVSYVMPNMYGLDPRDPQLRDERVGVLVRQMITHIENVGISYTTMACGTWYEWSLALGEQWFGFSIKERKVTFVDDGEIILQVSTWQHCGRALASLLSLPESDASPCLSDWKDEPLYISSFHVSQRDMLDSFNRVLNTTDKDWDIQYVPATERIKEGEEEFAKGLRTGIAKNLYGQLFMRSRAHPIDKSKSAANEILGLPKESLDEATNRAVGMVESGWKP